jgi:hypothetical protein
VLVLSSVSILFATRSSRDYNFASFSVIMPPSALDRLGKFARLTTLYRAIFTKNSHTHDNKFSVLKKIMFGFSAASLHIEYPMLFEVHNAAAERTSHCGVLEFIAEEGMIYMPYWVC